MGKSKKTKGQKVSKDKLKLLPKGLKGLQQTIFWKSNSNADKTPAKTDDQASTGSLSSQGSAVNVASAATSGSTHNMLPPIIHGAQNLNSASAKSVTSSGYGSLPGSSTRSSVTETTLPPIPGHTNINNSDSDGVQKLSPETSPLATKKWSVSSHRRSREEPNGWVPRNSRHRMSVVSTYNVPSRPSQSSNYSFTPMTITQLAHRQSAMDFTSSSQVAASPSSISHVVKINKYEYSLTSASGHTSIEVREPKTRNRKTSDLYSKKPSLTNRASIVSLPPLDERQKEPNPRPQRNSYSFNSKVHTEKENNLVVTASRLSISNNFTRRPSITSRTSDTSHRRSVHRISITSVDDGRIPASNDPPAIIEEPVERPASKRRYGTIMLESPIPSLIQRADDTTFGWSVQAPAATNGRRDSLVVPGVPQIIFISPTPDPSHGMCSPPSSSTSPSEQQ